MLLVLDPRLSRYQDTLLDLSKTPRAPDPFAEKVLPVNPDSLVNPPPAPETYDVATTFVVCRVPSVFKYIASTVLRVQT